MKNADQPAYPKTKGEHDCGFTVDDCHGLTKRELIAAMILASFTSKMGLWEFGMDHGPICKEAIKRADELLKQLESK